MSAEESLDAYLAASQKAWRTFMDYRMGVVGEGAVNRANRLEDEALAAHRRVIANLTAKAA